MEAIPEGTAIWRVEDVPADRCYRFVNLQDHAAWRVVIHGCNGLIVKLPGHVSYGHGSFCQPLEPGTYWLTWDNTAAMLEKRPDETPRPKLQSAVFSVPFRNSRSINLARAQS